jgi:2-polyprenyl-3-methyl-5-hydroxy-6-metoxy-1,4-benzoquinol methylase
MKNRGGSRLWDLMGLFYEHFFRHFLPHQKLNQEIIESLKRPASSSVCLLDAGCGPGLLSLKLARRGYYVVGVDRSPEMLKRAQKKKHKENLCNLMFLERNLNIELDLQAHSFHTIFLIHSLYLMDNPKKTLQNLSSTLCKDGEMIMCNPFRKLTFGELAAGGRSFLREVLREKGFHSFILFLLIALAMGALNIVIQQRKKKAYYCWNEDEIKDLLKSCGLKIRWLKKSCLADSHLLLCAVKDR